MESTGPGQETPASWTVYRELHVCGPALTDQMDSLYASNLRHGADVKASFPEKLSRRCCADFDALSGPYTRAQGRVQQALADLDQNAALIQAAGLMSTGATAQLIDTIKASQVEKGNLVNQIGQLQEHVTRCMAIWQVARCGKLGADKSVEEHYRGQLEGIPLATRIRDTDSSVQNGQLRLLARVWHSLLSVDDLNLLCGDEYELRRLKVSCAAHQADRKDCQIFP